MEPTWRDLREQVADLMRADAVVPYMLTFLFERLPGPTPEVLAGMGPPVEHVCDALLDEADRSERAARLRRCSFARRTRFVAAPARFGPARARKDPDDALINDGLHMRALLPLHRGSALAADLAHHVWKDRTLYRGRGRALRRIDVRRVKRGQEESAAARLFAGVERDPSFEAHYSVVESDHPCVKILASRLHGYLGERNMRWGLAPDLPYRWLLKEVRRGAVQMLGVTWDDEGELVADEAEPEPGFLDAWKRRSTRH